MSENNNSLKLDQQISFALYACSKEIVRLYKPYLDDLDLTYTQYLVLLVLWEYEQLCVKELGTHLYLDSGTLTPVLRKLENKGLVVRTRARQDERNLIITLTAAGRALRNQVEPIPAKIRTSIGQSPEEAEQLYSLLRSLLNTISE